MDIGGPYAMLQLSSSRIQDICLHQDASLCDVRHGKPSYNECLKTIARRVLCNERMNHSARPVEYFTIFGLRSSSGFNPRTACLPFTSLLVNNSQGTSLCFQQVLRQLPRMLKTLRITPKLLAPRCFTREPVDDGIYLEKHYLDADVLCALCVVILKNSEAL